jgi:23S rRNA (uridine2552-2'-O)-methyltransferase
VAGREVEKMAKKLEMSNAKVEETDTSDKPVSEGETVTAEINDLGEEGDGIARIDGYVLFVPGGHVDEKYEIEVTQVGPKFGFAEIV